MRKYLAPLFFALAASLWAEIGEIDGAGLNLNFSSTVLRDTDANGDTFKASRSQLFLQPSLHFFIEPEKETEFVPFLTFGVEWEDDTDSISGSIDDDVYRISLGGGASLLWHFLKTWRIDLVTGLRGEFLFGLHQMGDGAPEGTSSADAENSTFDIQGYVPLAMDFILTRDFTLRLTADVVKIGYHYDRNSYDDGEDSSGIFESTFPFLDSDNMAIVSLAGIYYFGNK